MKTKRIILAVSGASGSLYAVALANALDERDDVELHVILSDAARKVLALETDLSPEAITGKAYAVHSPDDIAAPPASGSWRHDGMIICPCSMATLSAVATGYGHSLIHRAADVTLKERGSLVLVPREAPYSAIHLENMLTATRAGAIVLPASPGFYHRPATIEDLANHLAGKILDQLDIPHTLFDRWGNRRRFMEITWFGHANFRIKAADATLFIDPFFVGNPAAPTTYQEIEECNLILITHDHNDHIGQALELAIKHDAEVIAIFDVIQDLIALGLPQHLGVGMNIGGTVVRQGLEIKMVQAMHSSASGTAAGFIITQPDGLCVYNSGDTGLFGDMELFGKFHDIDIAILPIGGRFTMDAQQAAYACNMLKPKKIIPQHWGTWPILAQNTESMEEHLTLTAPETELVTLEIGKPKTF